MPYLERMNRIVHLAPEFDNLFPNEGDDDQSMDPMWTAVYYVSFCFHFKSMLYTNYPLDGEGNEKGSRDQYVPPECRLLSFCAIRS